ncbi:MAG TPA: DUF1587 domain-containing protein, partial [Polyangiales bacterium]
MLFALLASAAAGLGGCTGDAGGPAGPGGSGAAGNGSDAPSSGTPGAPGTPGTPGSPGAPAGSSGQALTCRPEQVGDTGASVLRRLTKLEYTLTLKELLALSALPDAEAVPEDADRDGFRSVSALHTLSAEHLRGY